VTTVYVNGSVESAVYGGFKKSISGYTCNRMQNPTIKFVIITFIFSAHFISFDVQQCHANKLFCNKIWQASKYTVMYLERFPSALRGDLNSSRGELSKLDRWILSRLAHMVSEVNRALSTCDFHFATSAVKTFLYSEFCDFYLVSTHMGN
jgi:valyl-tRNA synthetase